MPHSALSALSISTLKTVLYRNHVQTGLVVEKSELVAKVERLVADEKAEREAARLRAEEEERELQELREVMARSRREQQERIEREREAAQGQRREGGAASDEASAVDGLNSDPKASPSAPFTNPSTPTATPPSDGASLNAPAPSSPTRTPSPGPPRGKMTAKAQAMASHLGRTGLCVICQDEEANIAIVDCGHLAMCRTCADLIMGSTRECPLCRTRIVTEARLLRIFKS